jgi:penicillin-binding protein 1C
VLPNTKGHYTLLTREFPDALKKYLLTKEDRFFYYHIGINPVSMVRALVHYVHTGKSGGSSTITEQLAKNLLQTENDRTIRNKLRELLYAFSIELFMRKDTIFSMYTNTVYLGNQLQGFETASRTYFNKTLADTSEHEQMMLLATLSFPTSRNPKKEENEPYARALFNRFIPDGSYVAPSVEKILSLQNAAQFEFNSLGVSCEDSCTTTLDTTLMSHIRTVLARAIEESYTRGIRTGAVVVIDAKTSELLAIIGSPEPTRIDDGGQINMALESRPIGSTVKPFIYLKGFMDGLRPYTIVDDREYRYPIATGYSLYPKNYDGTYHGEITLHYALSNSLNVPSVKVLEYIGLGNFYDFLTQTLRFIPLQPLDSYQYGIALGGLEMDLLTLSHYMTLFPREGTLAPLRIVRGENTPFTTPHATIDSGITVAPKEYVELVSAILSDRHTGVEQFGQKSNLNLSVTNYGVKTGTSRDFHDSWVIGYTRDLVVGVWLGNAENTALAQVSGQSGAGTVWHDVMEYLVNTPYYTDSPLPTESIHSFSFDNTLEWGLKADVIDEHENLLLSNRLILSIHEGDVFELTKETHIPLRARTDVTWFQNGTLIGTGKEQSFTPTIAGLYEIEARTEDDTRERVRVSVTLPQ